MIAEKIILLFALLFFILSLFLFCGKGKWLIAGYNTASKEEKERYNENKLCRAIGVICLVLSLMLCAMAYLGYRVDSGKLKENAMLLFAAVFAAVILITVFAAISYINRHAKK